MAEPLDLLDSRHYEAVRLPATDAAPLPNWCYTSENWYRLEIEQIFRKVWVYVGHASRISEAGDFFTVDVAGAPVIVIRGRRRYPSFHSYRHRGARIAWGEATARH